MAYKNTLPIQMRFNDLDMFGHVNNAMYMQYLDLGKVNYLGEVLAGLFNYRREAMVIAHIECDFVHPSLANEQLAVQTRISHIGESSMTLEQQIINSDTLDVKCTATTVMVGFDIINAIKMTIPDTWRERITAYES